MYDEKVCSEFPEEDTNNIIINIQQMHNITHAKITAHCLSGVLKMPSIHSYVPGCIIHGSPSLSSDGLGLLI
jgi:hypothetical protein